jgi:FkbM family methyltransferase
LEERLTSIYLGNGIALTKTADGRKLFLPTSDLSIVPHLLLGETWESWITPVVSKQVRPGDIVVEVGSNCGWYTTLLGRLVGPTGHVHAFEAISELADLVTKSLDINGLRGQVTMNAVGVWEKDGEKAIAFFTDHQGGSTFASDAVEHGSPLATLGVPRTVPVVSLTSYFHERPTEPRPSFMKIDAEGSEAAILRGAGDLLQGVGRMVIEYNPTMLRACGEEPPAFLVWLADQGFKLLEITPPHGNLRPVNLEELLARGTMTELLCAK